jgi:Holliday junction resolvase
MSGARHRRKGNRAERALVAFLRNRGFAAERIPLSGAVGGSFIGDITIPLLGRDFVAEVKVRCNPCVKTARASSPCPLPRRRC